MVGPCRIARPDLLSLRVRLMCLRWIGLSLLLLMLSFLYRTEDVLAEERTRIAVMPLQVHALKAGEDLEPGFDVLLRHGLKERGFVIIPLEEIKKLPLSSLKALGNQEILAAGRELRADWVIVGSLTRIGKRASIDLKVYDIGEERPPFSLYSTAEDLDNLEDTAKRMATGIDNRISGVPHVELVQVRGNRRVEEEAILAVVETKKGDRVDYDRLDQDLRDIYRMGFFKDIAIETEEGSSGTIVIFRVVEKPSIGRIAFEGNNELKDDVLKEELGIKPYSILDNNEVKQGIRRLEDYYRKKGFYNVDIRDQIDPLPNNEVLVTYKISENEKVYISEIEFVGNNTFDDDDLKEIMETSERGFFSWLTDSGYLDDKKLEFDVYKIGSFYHNQGYIKAKVDKPKITYDKEKGLLILIEIDEGNQYHVRDVLVEGDLIVPVEELLEKIRINKEKVFNRELIRKDILTLRDIYSDEGYAYAEVTPLTSEDKEEFAVDITYRISKEQKVYFERINIRGNRITRDKVIRRELKAIEGGYFSGKALKRSTQNLNRLGFFEDVKVQTKKGSREDLMVLDIDVTERPTGTFSVGAGYSSSEKAFSVVKISQENLFGRGQSLSLSAMIGGESDKFDIRFIEPWLFDKPLSADVQVYKWETEYDEYTKDSVGGALGFGFPLVFDDHTRGYIKYGFDDADITDIAESAATAIKEMEGKNITSSITFMIKRDSRDRRWNTSRGSINSFSYEYAGGILGGDIYFDKYLARSAWYFPLFWDTVLVAQGRWGYVKQRSGGKLPVYQKFSLGGINSVRGFDGGSISPEDPETGDKIGGEKMMVYNLEYRFPLFKEQGFVGLFFFDAGNVFTEEESYTFSGIRRSAGCGIRWYSPLGPLRLEYGWNLDPLEDEDSGQWEFTVGGYF